MTHPGSIRHLCTGIKAITFVAAFAERLFKDVTIISPSHQYAHETISALPATLMPWVLFAFFSHNGANDRASI